MGWHWLLETEQGRYVWRWLWRTALAGAIATVVWAAALHPSPIDAARIPAAAGVGALVGAGLALTVGLASLSLREREPTVRLRAGFAAGFALPLAVLPVYTVADQRPTATFVSALLPAAAAAVYGGVFAGRLLPASERERARARRRLPGATGRTASPPVLVVDLERTFDFPATYARTSHDAIARLDGDRYEEIWLDDDLGPTDSVHPLVARLEHHAALGEAYPVGTVVLHTDNPIARERIAATLGRHYRIRNADAPSADA